MQESPPHPPLPDSDAPPASHTLPHVGKRRLTSVLVVLTVLLALGALGYLRY
jgi:hypothetical protein